MRPAAYCQSFEPWARLKFHAGWSGWTRPPTMAGGGGGGVAGLHLQEQRRDLNALRLDASANIINNPVTLILNDIPPPPKYKKIGGRKGLNLNPKPYRLLQIPGLSWVLQYPWLWEGTQPCSFGVEVWGWFFPTWILGGSGGSRASSASEFWDQEA